MATVSPTLPWAPAGVSILLGNGDGTFQTPSIRYIATSTESSLAAGDVNDDGQLDLAVAGLNTNDVTVLLNDGLWPSNPAGAPRRQAPHRPAKTAALVTQLAGDILHSDRSEFRPLAVPETPTRRGATDQALIALADSLSMSDWQPWWRGREFAR